MDFTETIRSRHECAVQRALGVLEVYGASDAATRATLLQVAEKSLADPRVASRWISLFAVESDPSQRQRLLSGLAQLDFRLLPSNSDCIAQVLICLDQADARDWALYCLTQWAPRDPQLIAPLIAAYRSQRDDRFARNILIALLDLGDASPELLDFFSTVLDSVKEELKIALVQRLLERDALSLEVLEKLLAPSEPSAVKVLVLNHAIDRSISLEKPTIEILCRDVDPACRYAAAWALTETGAVSDDVLNALLHAATNDPDERVREFLLGSFEHTLNKTPGVIKALLESLRQETSHRRAALILKLLSPHVYRDDQIVPALTSMLGNNPKVNIALDMIEMLGVLAPWNENVRTWLIDAYERLQDDWIKAAILKPLSKLQLDDARISKLCVDAIKLSDPDIQQWGLQGILALPFTPENTDVIADCADLLLAREIALDLRLRLAHKLALLPQKSVELRTRLRGVVAQTRNSQIRKICEDACNNALNDTVEEADPSSSAVDWNDWVHRAEVEHRGNGIFPAIYEHYDEAPDSARRVLKALLNPQCVENLYGTYGYAVNEHTILALLDRKHAIDDDVSRFCIGRVLTQDSGTPNGYLQYLAENPGFAKLKDSLWPIVDKRKDADAALLRSLIVAAYGDEDAAAQALIARVKSIRDTAAKGLISSASLLPYIRIATENLGWPQSRDILMALSEPGDLEGEALENVTNSLKKLGVSVSLQSEAGAQKVEAGFADD